MKYDYHIIVIGAGSGGLVVASAAAGLGAKVALIESEKMGGDCLNTGCVPSKTFLKSAHLAADIGRSAEYGLKASLASVDILQVMARVKSVIKDIEPRDSKERYESLGVDVLFGKGLLIDKHTVQVGNKVITGKNIVIATGSQAVIPDMKGLDGVAYLTNRNVFDLTKLPEHLIVSGGGPVGLELGQAFKFLGSKVTIVDHGKTLFRNDDPEVGPVLAQRLRDDGIDLLLGSSVKGVMKHGETIEVEVKTPDGVKIVSGDQLLISAGRKPVSDDLGLEALGIEFGSRGHIKTNERLQTKIRNIYACGDVTGPYQFTHMAGYQAGVIVRNIVFKIPAKVNYSCVSWTTYTKPEVAHVGYTKTWAEKEDLFQEVVMVDLADIDRARCENDMEGFLKLILGKKGRLIGATLVGEKAGEIIPLATLAIAKGLKATVFLDLIFSYPTEAEIFKFASLQLVKKSFKSWQKKIIKTLFLR